jgi:hypothetical protein
MMMMTMTMMMMMAGAHGHAHRAVWTADAVQQKLLLRMSEKYPIHIFKDFCQKLASHGGFQVQQCQTTAVTIVPCLPWQHVRASIG